MDQRKSRRCPCVLDVEIVEGRQRHVYRARDVSRHGLFMKTDLALKERFLVQLSLQLPDGPMATTAFVIWRAHAEEGNQPGVGLQFFALSSACKRRWDRFVFDLAGSWPEAATPTRTVDLPHTATFLVKLKHEARLHGFLQSNLRRGGLYLATPVLKPEGSQVALVVVHPRTEAEWTVHGTVRRVRTDSPKGMDIRFEPFGDEAAEAFSHFVWDGVVPDASRSERPPTPPPAPTPDLPINIEVDMSALEDSANFEWDEVSDFRMVLDFDLETESDFDGREGIEHAPEPPISGFDVPIPDIADFPDRPDLGDADAAGAAATAAVDLSEGEESTSDEAGDLAEAPIVARASEAPASTRSHPSPATPSAGFRPVVPLRGAAPESEDSSDDGAEAFDDHVDFEEAYVPEEVASEDLPPLPPPPPDPSAVPGGPLAAARLSLALSCSSCRTDFGRFEVGGLRGHVGLVAHLRPFWNESANQVVSVPRIRPRKERVDVQRILGNSLLSPIGLERLFEIAALAGPPVDPRDGHALVTNELVTALEKAIANLESDETSQELDRPCPECGRDGALHVMFASSAEPLDQAVGGA